jgi:hypothetical protein
LSNTEGLFEAVVYYTSDGGGAAKGYVYQTAVARGETAARLTPGSSGGPILQASYQYDARTVGSATIHPVAAQTAYPNDDGAGGVTTSYAYTWYTNSFQVQQQTTTLPAVSTSQNGSGNSATRKQWFDSQGNLAWSMDERGRVTYYQYDSLTDRLERTIGDIDDATAEGLSLTPPTGWTLPASGGANQIRDYQYDALGRLTQTLGPAHTADVGGTPTNVRTATWTVYNDAGHETRSAQGYVVVATGAAAIVGPISITKTDADSRVTHDVQSTYTGTVADLATATIAQSASTAWTTYQYENTRLVSTRVYDDIPASGTGQSGTNYDERPLTATRPSEAASRAGRIGRLRRTARSPG